MLTRLVPIHAACVAATLAVLGAPSAAVAAAPDTVTLTASGAAAKQLRRAAVRLDAPGARATRLVDGSTRLTFTVASARVRETAATLTLRGAVRFRRAGRSVRADGLRLVATTAAGRLSGRVAGARVVLLDGAPGAQGVLVDAGARTVVVRRTTTRLAAAFARALGTALGLPTAPSGSFGPVAAQPLRASDPGTTVPAPVASTAPAPTATAVASATLVWRVRESFIRYITTGQGTTVRDGATADPPETLPDAGVPLVYQFRFPLRSGWTDPTTGAAAVTFSGGVRFRYTDHTIDFVTQDPEIELDGAASRMIVRLSGSDGTPFSGTRAVLLQLRPDRAAARTVSPDGRTITYDRIPAFIPAGAVDSVFAGFYLAGAPFGSVSLTITTP